MYIVIHRHPESSLDIHLCRDDEELETLLGDIAARIIGSRHSYGMDDAELKVLTEEDLTKKKSLGEVSWYETIGVGRDNATWPVWTALVIRGNLATIRKVTYATKFSAR